MSFTCADHTWLLEEAWLAYNSTKYAGMQWLPHVPHTHALMALCRELVLKNSLLQRIPCVVVSPFWAHAIKRVIAL